KFGAVQPNIQKIPGTGRILVELPGVENPQRVRNLLQGTAQLEFIEVYTIQDIYPSLAEVNTYLVSLKKPAVDSTTGVVKEKELEDDLLLDSNAPKDTSAVAETVEADTTAAADTTKREEVSELFSLNKSGYGLSYSVRDTAKINAILAMPKVQAMCPSMLTFYWEKKATPTKDGNHKLIELLACNKSKTGEAKLAGEVITEARWKVPQDGRGLETSMNVRSAGAKARKKMTSEASRGSS